MDLQRRWPRLVQTLGVSEHQALEIVETDVTPLPPGNETGMGPQVVS